MQQQIIKQSKERCLQLGLQTTDIPEPKTKLTAAELKHIKNTYDEIMSVVRYFGDKIMALLQGTPIMILLTDNEGHIISLFGNQTINETLQQLGIVEGIQLNEEDMGTNAPYLALKHHTPVQLVGSDHFHEVLWEAACYCVPFNFKKINGLSGTVAIMAPAQFDNPYPITLIANMVDSMEREILLRRSNQKQAILYDLLIQTMSNGIIITDTKGNVTEINRFASDMIGYKRHTADSLYNNEYIGNYVYQVIREAKRFNDIEIMFHSHEGNRVVCLLDVIPIHDASGELMGSYTYFKDITERYELERQVITSEKYSVIGKLAAGLAHEIRNPLTTVMGFMHLFRQRFTDPKDIGHLNLICSELEMMKKLISDFVMMAKPSTPDRKPCIIEELIHDTVQLMVSQAILNNVEIRLSAMKESTQVLIDQMQIKQVLVNLIQNAIEAMPQGGTITLNTCLHKEPNKMFISIKDNGIGMSEQEMKEAMNPFFTTKETGLGLGLSICYRIIENHGGVLSFQSKQHEGTEFIIQLPYQ